MFKAAKRFAVSLMFVAGVAATGPALAGSGADISSRAFTNHAVYLYDAWGDGHRAIGQLPGGLEVRVDRCSRLWCAVHGRFGHGWVFLYSLSFGQGPNSIFWPPVERHGPYHPWHFLGEY